MDFILKNIEKLRKDKGFSHEYMAHKLDISQSSYCKIEKNITKLSVERLFKLAEILDTKVAEILGLDVSNQFNQTTKDQSTGYLQKIENFYQENKEQNQKIIEMYELRLQDKEAIIEQLKAQVNTTPKNLPK